MSWLGTLNMPTLIPELITNGKGKAFRLHARTSRLELHALCEYLDELEEYKRMYEGLCK